jgi:hypothetical protein
MRIAALSRLALWTLTAAGCQNALHRYREKILAAQQ